MAVTTDGQATREDPHAAASRRVLLGGVSAAGLIATLAACGQSGESTDAGGAPPAGGGTSTGGGNTGGGGASAGPLAKISDIPVGGGKIFETRNVVVTQPTQGTFKAFSATCTHQGCQVGSIADGMIVCPCHQSAYSIKDGSVKRGPASRALATETISVEGGEIILE